MAPGEGSGTLGALGSSESFCSGCGFGAFSWDTGFRGAGCESIELGAAEFLDVIAFTLARLQP